MLNHMTDYWRKIAVDLSEFCLNSRKKNPNEKSSIRIYNCWINSGGSTIEDADLAVWAVQHIKSMLELPINTLEDVVQMDLANQTPAQNKQ